MKSPFEKPWIASQPEGVPGTTWAVSRAWSRAISHLTHLPAGPLSCLDTCAGLDYFSWAVHGFSIIAFSSQSCQNVQQQPAQGVRRRAFYVVSNQGWISSTLLALNVLCLPLVVLVFILFITRLVSNLNSLYQFIIKLAFPQRTYFPLSKLCFYFSCHIPVFITWAHSLPACVFNDVKTNNNKQLKY